MVKTDTIKTVDALLAQTDADDLPDGWTGGEARHTGGGIWLREFTHADRQIRVEYSLSEDSPGVGRYPVRWDDDVGQWLPDGDATEVASPETDAEKFAAALELMADAEPPT